MEVITWFATLMMQPLDVVQHCYVCRPHCGSSLQILFLFLLMPASPTLQYIVYYHRHFSFSISW